MHALSDEPFLPYYATPSGGDGASALPDAHVFLAQHQRKVNALVENETGVRFESLALFAEPLFGLYDLDAADAFALPAAPDTADEATIAVIEAARVLWAYFSLPQSERVARHHALATFLLGPDATPEDEADLDQVLDTIEAHWQALTPEDIELAESVDAETLDFDALVAHPAFAPEPPASPTERTYGAERLSEMDARAIFAQPLLEKETDPDALDDAMDRADEYWTLAQLQGLERDAYLDEIVGVFAIDAKEATAIRAEAETMIDRFQTLFPHQG